MLVKSFPLILILSLVSLIGLSGSNLLRGKDYHLSMYWNLFLAWTPIVIWLFFDWAKNKTGKLNHPLTVGLGVLWILFFPNAPYLVTDFFYDHMGLLTRLVFAVFALTGIAITCVYLEAVENTLAKEYGKRIASTATIILIFATSVALFLGRVGRWNSWDIFTNPFSILASLFENQPTAAVFIIASATSITVVYHFYKSLFSPP